MYLTDDLYLHHIYIHYFAFQSIKLLTSHALKRKCKNVQFGFHYNENIEIIKIKMKALCKQKKFVKTWIIFTRSWCKLFCPFLWYLWQHLPSISSSWQQIYLSLDTKDYLTCFFKQRPYSSTLKIYFNTNNNNNNKTKTKYSVFGSNWKCLTILLMYQ